MAKELIRCGNKIGFFKKVVEGGYCSEECAEESQKEMAAQQQQADAARDEAKRRSAEEAERELAEQKEAAEHDQFLNTCPKCGKGWEYTPAAEEGGTQAGHCSACGLSVTFTAIEACPHCRSQSLIVAPDVPKRCPRCKYSG